MTQLIAPGLVHVYANHGRWVADCANPHCDSAWTMEERFGEGFICVECGRPTGVVWPPADVALSIERILLMRPARRNQNWVPGETPDDLFSENMAHGVMADYANECDTGVVIAMTDGVITLDKLPVLNPRRELVR